MDETEWFRSLNEAAVSINRSARTISRGIKSGKVRAIKEQGHWKIAKEDVPSLAKKGKPVPMDNEIKKRFEEHETRIKHLEILVREQQQRLVMLENPETKTSGIEDDDFTNLRQIGKFLERHGVNLRTAESWKSMPLNDALGELEYAVKITKKQGGKARGRTIHQCTLVGCICHNKNLIDLPEKPKNKNPRNERSK